MGLLNVVRDCHTIGESIEILGGVIRDYELGICSHIRPVSSWVKILHWARGQWPVKDRTFKFHDILPNIGQYLCFCHKLSDGGEFMNGLVHLYSSQVYGYCNRDYIRIADHLYCENIGTCLETGTYTDTYLNEYKLAMDVQTGEIVAYTYKDLHIYDKKIHHVWQDFCEFFTHYIQEWDLLSLMEALDEKIAREIYGYSGNSWPLFKDNDQFKEYCCEHF